jgi:hypothetical protein
LIYCFDAFFLAFSFISFSFPLTGGETGNSDFLVLHPGQFVTQDFIKGGEGEFGGSVGVVGDEFGGWDWNLKEVGKRN